MRLALLSTVNGAACIRVILDDGQDETIAGQESVVVDS